MSLRSKLFALTYDRQMAKVEKATLRGLRESLLAAASGECWRSAAGQAPTCPSTGPGPGR